MVSHTELAVEEIEEMSDRFVDSFGDAKHTPEHIALNKFDGIFPQVVSPIELDWATVDQIESFQVTFSYDYWTVSGGSTGNAGGR